MGNVIQPYWKGGFGKPLLKRSINFSNILYGKSQSKIDLVSSLANEFPISPNTGYLLCDSWYTCDKVMDAFIRKGFYAGLKTNRILYPCSIRTSLNAGLLRCFPNKQKGASLRTSTKCVPHLEYDSLGLSCR